VADEAQGSEVGEIALAAAFRDRQNVIGVPQRSAIQTRETPAGEEFEAVRSTGPFQVNVGSAGINLAQRADAAVARQDLLAQIAGVGAKTPFVNAPIGTECETASGNFQVTPAAERAAVGSFAKAFSIGVAAGHGAGGTHEVLMSRKVW